MIGYQPYCVWLAILIGFCGIYTKYDYQTSQVEELDVNFVATLNETAEKVIPHCSKLARTLSGKGEARALCDSQPPRDGEVKSESPYGVTALPPPKELTKVGAMSLPAAPWDGEVPL